MSLDREECSQCVSVVVVMSVGERGGGVYVCESLLFCV